MKSSFIDWLFGRILFHRRAMASGLSFERSFKTSSRFRNIGAYIKTVTSAFAIAATAEVDGSAIQTVTPGETYQSCKLLIHVGAVAGAPSSFSVAGKLQTSATARPDGRTLRGRRLLRSLPPIRMPSLT